MTFFIKTPVRQYEISDVYLIALIFCIFFAVGTIFKSAIKKQHR